MGEGVKSIRMVWKFFKLCIVWKIIVENVRIIHNELGSSNQTQMKIIHNLENKKYQPYAISEGRCDGRKGSKNGLTKCLCGVASL